MSYNTIYRRDLFVITSSSSPAAAAVSGVAQAE